MRGFKKKILIWEDLSKNDTKPYIEKKSLWQKKKRNKKKLKSKDKR